MDRVSSCLSPVGRSEDKLAKTNPQMKSQLRNSFSSGIWLFVETVGLRSNFLAIWGLY